MTAPAALLLAVAAALAVVDWVAVARGRKPLEYFAKPATMAALIGVALTLAPASEAQQRWFAVALAFGAVGDVFLMLPRNYFLPGLAAFLVGHLAFVVGFYAAGVAPVGVAVIGILILLPASLLLPRIVHGILRQGKPALVPPVALYSLVITVMLASAIASAKPLAVVGGLLFYASDSLIGLNRFVMQRRWMPLAIIVTYHAGQAGLVLSMTR